MTVTEEDMQVPHREVGANENNGAQERCMALTYLKAGHPENWMVDRAKHALGTAKYVVSTPTINLAIKYSKHSLLVRLDHYNHVSIELILLQVFSMSCEEHHVLPSRLDTFQACLNIPGSRERPHP